MAFVEPPPMPEFLARELPAGSRCAYRLERGAHAGRRLHFLDAGPREGPIALLLHGNPTWSYLWRRVIALLPEVRCIVPDLLGFGFSDRLPRLGDHTMVGHAEALVELWGALDPPAAAPPILVGQDWGGPLVVAAGRRLPAVAALLLANTAVVLPRHSRGARFHRLARLPVVSQILFRLLGFPLRSLHRVQGDPRSIQGEVARAYRWPMRRLRDRVGPLALARMVPVEEDHPSRAEMEQGTAWVESFPGPLTLVWGRRDPVLGRALPRHVRELPRARVVETEAGHFLQEEVPEVLAAEIQKLANAIRVA